MTPEVPGMQEFEHDWLETQAHETIRMAQRVAARMRERSSASSAEAGWTDIYYSYAFPTDDIN